MQVATKGRNKDTAIRTQNRVFAETVTFPSSQRRLSSSQNIYRNEMQIRGNPSLCETRAN